MTNRSVIPLLAMLLLFCTASEALGHGGMWRGPYGVPPGTRMPFDPIPRPLPPQSPPALPGAEGTPGVPRLPSGPGALPDAPKPVPSPQPNVPSPGARPRGPTGPGLEHWVYWWNLNRERILGLREIRNKRLRSRTQGSGPHFIGKGGQGNRPLNDTPEARNAIYETLVAAATDGNRDVSTGAIIALGKAGDARAIPLLMKLARDSKPHFSVNESALLALGMIGSRDADVRGFLTEIAGDSQVRTRTRAFAALGLGFLGDAGALPALMSSYKSRERSREVPAAALIALGLLEDELVVPDLAKALSGPAATREKDDYLRAYSAAALGMIRSRAGMPALLNALRDRNVEVRRQAVLSLGAMLRPEDVRPLQLLLHVMSADRDPQVRAYVAVSLGEIGAPATADNLLYAYRKGDSLIVPYAALGLGLLARECEDPTVRERIKPFLRAQFLERGNSDLKGALAVALGMAGDKDSVRPLLKVLEGAGDPQLRGHAAVALGLIGAEEAIPALRAALTDRNDPNVQREVALALGLLADREAIRLLSELVRNGRTEYVRGSAAAALGRLASPDTAESLRETLADKRKPATTRAFVAVALGLVMDPHIIPLLSRLGEHFNHRMSTEAVSEVLTFL